MKTCEIPRCKRSSMLIYAAFPDNLTLEVEVCDKHWEMHCDDKDKFDIRKIKWKT